VPGSTCRQTPYGYTVKAINGDDVPTAESAPPVVKTSLPPLDTAYKVEFISIEDEVAVEGGQLILEAAVQDCADTTITGSSALIDFSVTGDGTLIGTTSKNAVNGLATVMLESGVTVETVTVNAVSSGLVTGQKEVSVVADVPVKVILGMAMTDPDKGLIDANRTSDYAQLTATIKDDYNNTVYEAISVTFTVTIGNAVIEEVSKTTTDGVTVWKYYPDTAGTTVVEVVSGGLTSASVEFEVAYYNIHDGTTLFEGDSGLTRVEIGAFTFVKEPGSSEGWGDELSVRIDITKGIFNMDEEPANAKYVPDSMRIITPMKYSPMATSWQEIVFSTVTYIPDVEEDYRIYISIPYPDEQGDGMVDEIDVPAEPEYIRGYCYNEDESSWEPVQDWSQIDKGNRVAKFPVKHLSKYCLMAVEVKLGVNNVFNYPNPLESGGGTTLVYSLTDKADTVDIRIYTISGRLISKVAGDTDFGENTAWWDGLDRNKGKLANGVYIYKITATKDKKSGVNAGKLVIMQ